MIFSLIIRFVCITIPKDLPLRKQLVVFLFFTVIVRSIFNNSLTEFIPLYIIKWLKQTRVDFSYVVNLEGMWWLLALIRWFTGFKPSESMMFVIFSLCPEYGCYSFNCHLPV